MKRASPASPPPPSRRLRFSAAGRCLTVILALSACGEGEPARPGASAGADLGSVFEGVQMVRQEPDGTSWRLDAREGRAWEGEGSGWLRGVKAVMEREGRSVHLEAGVAAMERRDVLSFSEGVTLSWEGYRAEAERATYQRSRGWIVSSDPVRLHGPGVEVTGRGLEVDVEGRRLRVLSEAHTVFREAGR